MKKSLVTLLAAATLVAATAPAFAETTVDVVNKHLNPVKAAQDKAALIEKIDHARVVVVDAENEVARAQKVYDAAVAKLNAAKSQAADALALVGDHKDGGVTNNGQVDPFEGTNVTGATDAAYQSALEAIKVELREVSKAEYNLNAAKEILAAEKANLDALLAKLAALNATAPAAKKDAHKSVAAASTATGQKTLPKTSAAK